MNWSVGECVSVSLCEGTYGTVFKAKNRESQEIVALKRVRLDDDDEVSSALLFYSSFLLFFYSSIVIFFYSSILIFLYSYSPLSLGNRGWNRERTNWNFSGGCLLSWHCCSTLLHSHSFSLQSKWNGSKIHLKYIGLRSSEIRSQTLNK